MPGTNKRTPFALPNSIFGKVDVLAAMLAM
jgi:hypothetical protein